MRADEVLISACAEDVAGAQQVRLPAGVLARVVLWPGEAAPGTQRPVSGSWLVLGLVGHDAVVGAPGAGAAGAGAVTAEHLRGRPAVQFHQVALRPAAVQPGVAEMVPEPVRVHRYPGLPSPPGDDLME
jgi:hypothetical protein